MTLPLEQSMEREMTDLTLTIDPNGLWRKQRYEFCNALEEQDWTALARMGVKRFVGVAVPEGKAVIFADLDQAGNFGTSSSSQSPNDEARSSVGEG